MIYLYYFGLIVAFLLLFFALGKSADFLVANTKSLSEKLGVRIFFLGIILGLFTTLPEMFIGLNALASGLDMLPFGNLIGGMIVMLTLILGGSIVLNRNIETDGRFSVVLPKFVFLILPLVLGAKGSLNHYDGIVIVLIYLLLVYYSLKTEKTESLVEEGVYPEVSGVINKTRHFFIKRFAKIIDLKNAAGREIVFIIIGLIAILVLSNIIVHLSELTLRRIGLNELTLGLIFFSLGTNLPEIVVTVKAWLNHASDLSISHLFGSAMANVLALGMFAILNNFSFSVQGEYIFLLVTLFMVLTLVALFYHTGKKFSRLEGAALLVIYFWFVFYQLYYLSA